MNKSRGDRVKWMFRNQPITKKSFADVYTELSMGCLDPRGYETVIMFIESYPGLKEIVKPGLLQVFKDALKLVKEEKKIEKKKKETREKESKYWNEYIRPGIRRMVRDMIDTTEMNYYLQVVDNGHWNNVVSVKDKSQKALDYLEAQGFTAGYDYIDW
jgi:hypothetical protein